MIVTWNEVWGRKYWKEYLGKLGTFAFIVEWISVRMPDKIISVSQHTKIRLIKDLKVKKEIIVSTNGINIKEIQKVEPSKQKSDIIFAGRLLTHKNVDMLVKSVDLLRRQIPNIKCLIIGNGPEKKRLEKMVVSLGLSTNVIFLDFLKKHEDLYSLIKSSKVFVLPSTREGFGIVVLEAMACGIPVITIEHDNNAASNIISHGKDGFICQLDTKEIAENIVRIIINGIRQKMSEECIKTAKTYSWDRIVNEIEEVYSI